MMNLIKKNIKFIILMLVVIIFGIVGIAYAIKVANFNPIGLNVTTSPIDVNITYDSSVNNDSITSSGKMVPINDSLVTGVDVTDERVIKAKFKVAGVSSNPDNTIYDVALRDINIDCDLRTEDVKWRLYKNGTLLTSGNLSPTFDVMSDNRLVLTDTQQDLTTTTDEYVFLLWISETCTGDISTCSKEQEQNKYLNKFFSASIKLEMSTKAKKTLVRNTASADSCSFSTTSVPVFNSLTYNGSEQTLVNSGTGYTLVNNTGTNAGEYVVTAKLNNGYKWTDGTTNDKVIKGKINKKTATVVADSQSISYGGSINSTKYTILDLLSGHSVSSVFLNTSTVDVGVGTITPTSARIVDSKGNDVTDNYYMSYVSGTLTVGCLSSSSITVNLPSTLTYGTSGTYTYTVSPTDLLVICTSSNSSIATCSVDTTNKKVTITPKGTGSVNITLKGEFPNSNDECSSVSTSKAITVNCSNTATEPTVISPQDYTGSIRIGVSGGANVDLGGTLSATNAGTYEGTATPSKGYCWSDNTNSSKSYSWTISKIPVPVTVTAKTGLSYNGSAQTLATVSNAQGTVYYSTSTKLTSSNYSSGSTTIPTGTNARTYTVYYYIPGNTNYQAKSGSVSVTIAKKTLTPTATANSKAYDGSTSATCNVSLSGIVSGDEVSASSTGNFSSSSAGEGKTVTCSNISLSGGDKDNYSLSTTSVTTTATIGYWKNNSNVYYENIANAINGTASGGTITLLYGYTESNAVTLSKSITMNTNGKTLNYATMSSTPITISSDGTLKVTGTGTINSDNLRGIINSGGTFNCSNASFTGSSIQLYTTSGTSTNTSCTFNKETVTDSDNANSVVAVSGGTFNMSGGSISGVSYGLYQSGGTANITGGTINGTTALRHNGGTANIKGGTLTGTSYGIYSKSGNLNIGTVPTNGTSINRHTNNKSDKVSPHIESTTSTTSYCGIYIENSVFRMYFGMVKAIGSAIKVSADNTNTVAIDGGSLISTGYVAYYNLSTARTALTGDAIIVANSSSSAINTKGTILINNDNDQSDTGLNGIQTYFSGCSGDACFGRYWGTMLIAKTGYGIYGNGTANLFIGNNSYSEDTSSDAKMYRNQGATICAGSSSFAGLSNLYWYVGLSFNNNSSYKSNVTTMNLGDSRDYLENYSTTATTCSRTIDDTTYSMTYSYYSYPKSKTTLPGTKVTTNATMYSFRAEATSCTGTSSCIQSNCSTLGDLKSGSVIYLIEKASGSSIYYNAWVKLSDFSSSPGAAYNQLAGVNNACSSTTYTTQVISGTTYVKARVPLKSSSCTNSCCASSCTIS